MDIPIAGDSNVEKMYIITDSGCASSGDNFVAVFSMFPKVSVVGRPTMGILDYSNVAFVQYDDFSLGNLLWEESTKKFPKIILIFRGL